MQVKKFEAPTLQEALDHVKRELGPEAIILQTKKYKRGFGLMSKPSVEVTAAVSERSMQKKQYTEARLPEPNRDALQKLPATAQAEFLNKYTDNRAGAKGTVQKAQTSQSANSPQPQKRLTATRYIDIDEDQIPRPAAVQASHLANVQRTGGAVAGQLGANALVGTSMSMEEELRHLKRMVEEMKNSQEEGALGSGAQILVSQSRMSTPALQDAFEQLIVNGVDKRYAYDLVKRTAFELGETEANNPEAVLDLLAAEMMRSTEISTPLSGIVSNSAAQSGNGPIVIALVGPTGVGKTTTVAKIASEAILKRNLKVGLVNLDSYKVAAFDQLGTYAKILNVPFRSAASAEDLQAAVSDFRGLDVVLVDTTGRSQKDPTSLHEMQRLLSSVPSVRTQIVLSVTTRDTELYDMVNRFAIFRPEGMIMSKLDEGTIYGAIYNISQKAKLPLLYFTTGQRVPEDIEDATCERVAALILDL
jgi:flagellar biosynthesis protein FlhF